jgi:hypothetical protein
MFFFWGNFLCRIFATEVQRVQEDADLPWDHLCEFGIYWLWEWVHNSGANVPANLVDAFHECVNSKKKYDVMFN